MTRYEFFNGVLNRNGGKMKQTDEQTAEEILRELNEKYNFRPDDEEEEIEDLVPDEEFGLRWKNGASDRRVRGDGIRESEAFPTMKEASSDEISEFLEKYMLCFENICDLTIQNTMIFDGINGGELMFYNTLMRSVVDVDCGYMSEREFQIFIYRMRFGMLKHAATIFNSLATASEYAKFTGISEPTVREQMKRGKLDVLPVSGVKFILVGVEELYAWNRHLMEKYMRKDENVVSMELRKKMADIYGRAYGGTVNAEDSVLRWVLSEEIYASFLVGAYKSRYAMTDAYQEYSRGIDDAVPLRVFASRIYEMGFKRYNTGKRGFYCWRKEK